MMNFRSATSDFHRKSEVALLIFSISDQVIWTKNNLYIFLIFVDCPCFLALKKVDSVIFCRYLT